MIPISTNPWLGLVAPTSPTAISARRVDPACPWHLFWAIDHEERCLLVLQHLAASAPHEKLPVLREIEIRLEALPGGQPVLVLRLLDAKLRDVFHQLCLDIVAATTGCANEAAAVTAAVARAWRWHHLLRGGGAGRLRPEEQKGLLGELLVLERYMLPAFGAAGAVAAWRGPVGAAKDFVSGTVAVESKARSSNAESVMISSEIQLAGDDDEQLFLHLCSIDPANPGDEGAYTLTDVAKRVREGVAAGGSVVQGRYDALLAAAGFDFADDYSDHPWQGGERSVYRVAGTFPRLTPDTMPPAVHSVHYALSLNEVGPFMVAPNELQLALIGSVQ
ncbi:MAG: PD-(D/E)XK motif protein [Bryocella sp.]